MHTTTLHNTPAATAETLAANFQVAELEPRLENAWSGGSDSTDIEHATPGGR